MVKKTWKKIGKKYQIIFPQKKQKLEIENVERGRWVFIRRTPSGWQYLNEFPNEKEVKKYISSRRWEGLV